MSKPDYSGTYHMVEQHNMDAYLEGLGEATLDFTASLVPEHATEPPSPGPRFATPKSSEESSNALISRFRSLSVAAAHFSAMKSPSCPFCAPLLPPTLHTLA